MHPRTFFAHVGIETVAAWPVRPVDADLGAGPGLARLRARQRTPQAAGPASVHVEGDVVSRLLFPAHYAGASPSSTWVRMQLGPQHCYAGAWLGWLSGMRDEDSAQLFWISPAAAYLVGVTHQLGGTVRLKHSPAGYIVVGETQHRGTLWAAFAHTKIQDARPATGGPCVAFRAGALVARDPGPPPVGKLEDECEAATSLAPMVAWLTAAKARVADALAAHQIEHAGVTFSTVRRHRLRRLPLPAGVQIDLWTSKLPPGELYNALMTPPRHRIGIVAAVEQAVGPAATVALNVADDLQDGQSAFVGCDEGTARMLRHLLKQRREIAWGEWFRTTLRGVRRLPPPSARSTRAAADWQTYRHEDAVDPITLPFLAPGPHELLLMTDPTRTGLNLGMEMILARALGGPRKAHASPLMLDDNVDTGSYQLVFIPGTRCRVCGASGAYNGPGHRAAVVLDADLQCGWCAAQAAVDAEKNATEVKL
jgi:hypothetical protein